MSNTADERRKNSNELVLSDGEYAYTQDATSGIIKTHTGPLVINITGQENPVVYDEKVKQFRRMALEQAAQQSPLAPQGSYCVLWNPSENGKHPDEKGKNVSPSLLMGQRVNIPGPCTFSLWPRQSAKVIKGHHLRSNQYLLVRVYDEEAARQNWGSAVVKLAVNAEGVGAARQEGVAREVPKDLSVGKLIVIRGTEVSFYIPPTGVEVVEAENGDYVREALTLERLEYCILIDEDGNKRYERGPAVVFPRPTEHFYEEHLGGDRIKAFRPIELSPVQGIHVKVIADYTDEATGKACSEGEELFITGKDTPIYFPRQEHSLVSYDGRSKHFAVAVPAGEARYVMERTTGEIRTVRGPVMLLPDPRTEVIVRRALSDRLCELMYPGNGDALAYNQRLRELALQAPTTRRGVVSEGQVNQGAKAGARPGRKSVTLEESVMERSQASSDTSAVLADEFSFSSTFTEPRTLTLHTRFAGVPTIDVWTGYAVMIVRKGGERRVEVGPKRVLLEYDEELEVLTLSTGQPKGSDKPRRVVYLKLNNNQVSDVIHAQTRDHVRVTLAVAMRVDFEGEPSKWFQVENYTQRLCDHVRAILKAKVRQVDVEAFYNGAEELVRDAVLGPVGADGQRAGLRFEENGMHVLEVEVHGASVKDDKIASLLEQARQQSLRAGIELAAAQRKLGVDREVEQIARDLATTQAETAAHKAALEASQIERDLALTLARLKAAVDEQGRQLEIQRAKDAVSDAGHTASLARKEKNASLEQKIEEAAQQLRAAQVQAETEATVKRLAAVQTGFSEALLALGNQDTLVKVADAMSVQQLLGGKNLPDVIGKVFENTPLEEVMKKVQARAGGV